ncbi:MAG: hypoxanthine phosphoribosyltransferase [Salibacteraceae bacterium]
MITVHDHQFIPYLSRHSINDEVARVGRELMTSQSGNAPYFLGVLNGSFMFFSDLMKAYSAPCEIGFVKAASYQGMESTGKVIFEHTSNLPIEGKDVIIVEDIVDTGKTLHALLDYLSEFNPNSIQVCTLLFKPKAYTHSHPIDYVCFEVENRFLLGYGLDFDGLGRNLPEVYILKE